MTQERGSGVAGGRGGFAGGVAGVTRQGARPGQRHTSIHKNQVLLRR